VRRPASTAQLELPLLTLPEPEPEREPPPPVPAVACARCGWYRAPAGPCPICGREPAP